MLNDAKIFIIIRNLQFKDIQTDRNIYPNVAGIKRDQRNEIDSRAEEDM